MNKLDIENWVIQNEMDMFHFFDIDGLPCDGSADKNILDWMVDHISKSSMYDYLGYDFVDIATYNNCHFTARAIAKILGENNGTRQA